MMESILPLLFFVLLMVFLFILFLWFNVDRVDYEKDRVSNLLVVLLELNKGVFSVCYLLFFLVMFEQVGLYVVILRMLFLDIIAYLCYVLKRSGSYAVKRKRK